MKRTLKKIPVAELKPYPGNPRRGNLQAIKDSLAEHGQYKPILVQESTNYVLAGNHTREAAAEMGYPDLDCIVIDVDDEKAKKIVLVDNRTSDLGGYDDEALAELLRDVGTLDGTGYSAVDYAEILGRATPIIAPDEPMPEPPAKPKTKVGDIITLGVHRLICGDASDPLVHKALRGKGPQHDMIWTDPPYGVNVHEIANQRADRDWTEMNADTYNAAELEEFLGSVFQLAEQDARAGAAIYIAHADQMREPVRNAMIRSGFSHRQTLVWIKNTLVVGRQDYQWRHEPILYGWKAGTHHWYGEFDKTTVIDGAGKGTISALDKDELVDLVWQLLESEPGTAIRVDRPSRSSEHPTMKPVDLVAKHLANSAPVDGIVFDPFGGSGTTLLAAEQTGRASRLIELEPSYCDVIVERWEKLTGKKAKR